MRVVHILAQTRYAIGKATILLPSIVIRQLSKCRTHPADTRSSLNLIAQGRQHPRPVTAHGAPGTAYAPAIHLGQGGKKVCSGYVVVGHKCAQIAAQHHHVAGNDIVAVAVYAFFPASFTPQGSIGGEHHKAVLGKIVTQILIAIKILRPGIGIFHHAIIDGKRPNHLFLANGKMGTVVVQQVDGRERSHAIGNQQVCLHAIPAAQTKLQLAGRVALALLLSQHAHVV